MRKSSKKALWILSGTLLAGICLLALGTLIFWPYFQDYDLERVDRAFGNVEQNIHAVEELKVISHLQDHVDASHSLHYYGSAYKALIRNPEPFYILAERGTDREKRFVNRVLSDGKKSYLEWYGQAGVEGSGSADQVIGKLSESGATNTVILDAFRKGIEVKYP